MKVLVINAGSSSLKYELFDMSGPVSLATGLLECIGEEQATLTQKVFYRDRDTTETRRAVNAADFRAGLQVINAALGESSLIRNPRELFGIGHRVVHGGERFKEPTLVDDRVIAGIRQQIPLAPLHNPANLLGIEETLLWAPEVPQVAVFDTAFHQTMPAHAYRYALPEKVYTEHQVRRYGFHGTSHRYVSRQAARYLQKPLTELNLIVFHLGNGASVTAVQGGRSVDTSLGMTPLEGLIMGTRCGDLDPAIAFYLMRVTGQSPQEVEDLLNRESGLKGICGDNDMRVILQRAENGDTQAQLALDMVTYRLKKYLGAYYAALGHVDAVIFTAGIGENAPLIRARACDNLTALGLAVDPEKNQQRSAGIQEIQSDTSTVKILVIPTDEEFQIAEQTVACIQTR